MTAACSAAFFMLGGCVQTLQAVGDSQAMGPSSVFDDAAIEDSLKFCERVRSRDRGWEQLDHRSSACDMLDSFVAARGQISPGSGQASSRDALAYFNHGANLADVFCATWFAQLDGARRSSRQAHSTVTGLGALTTAVQGFSGVEAPVIGLTSSVFNETAVYFDRAEQNYMLSPNLDTVHNSLFAFRQRFFDQIRRDELIVDEASAMRYLRQYEATCTALNVQYFINLSISRSGSGEVVPVPETTTPVARAHMEALKIRVANALNGDLVLSDWELTVVAAWLSLPPNTGEEDALRARRARVELDLATIRASSTSSQNALQTLQSMSTASTAALRDELAAGPAAENLADRVRAYLAEGDLRASEAVTEASNAEIEDLRADISRAVGAAQLIDIVHLTRLTAYWVLSPVPEGEAAEAIRRRRARIEADLKAVPTGSSGNLHDAFGGLEARADFVDRLRNGPAAAELDARARRYISGLDHAIAEQMRQAQPAQEPTTQGEPAETTETDNDTE
ncbi:MAG TPA: hypothetical protein VEA80_11915 [Vitreimonas sp.]|nr:hypothetical protein [Vitreimonas sp.]